MTVSESKAPGGFLNLAAKVILVTGGARGLGAASTRALIGGGAQMVVTHVDAAVGAETPGELGSGTVSSSTMSPTMQHGRGLWARSSRDST